MLVLALSLHRCFLKLTSALAIPAMYDRTTGRWIKSIQKSGGALVIDGKCVFQILDSVMPTAGNKDRLPYPLHNVICSAYLSMGICNACKDVPNAKYQQDWAPLCGIPTLKPAPCQRCSNIHQSPDQPPKSFSM